MRLVHIWWTHTRGYWGRNIRMILEATVNTVALLVIFTFFLGFYNVYNAVSMGLANGGVVSITHGVVISQGDLSKINWQDQNSIYLTQGGKHWFDMLYNALKVMILVVSAITLSREEASSINLSKIELESRKEDYLMLLRATFKKSLLTDLLVFQRFFMSMIAMTAGFALTRFLVVPVAQMMMDP
ncbi:MAG TPA: hypothetical protein VE177_08420, partial [Candidatus Binatus sp.]|nr:hypothetical protein [Candidatus Binatus sp.]